jgi:signal transduction histidine kinase
VAPAAVVVAGWSVVVLALLILRRREARRAELVRRACHELRGPLTALRLGVEVGLRRGGLPAHRLRALELELGRATRALEDLDAAPRGRLGPGVVSGEVELMPLLLDAVEAWRPAAVSRAVDLDVEFEPTGPGPPTVRGDRLRLAQAVENLLANAIEHGGGRVRVRVRASDQVVRIEVEDEGPGLAAPLGRLKRRGHGLRVASGVAEALGGRLLSAPSRVGARLVVELPVAAPAAEPVRLRRDG